MAVDRYRRWQQLGRWRRRYLGRWCEGRAAGHDVALLQPYTFMNESGQAVAAAAGGKQVPPERIVVVHDDLDFPFGVIRIRAGGGTGGHRGLESVAAAIGKDFIRVRIGIGRPQNPFVSTTDWVLSDFDATPGELEQVVDRAAECIHAIVTGGVEAAMNACNRRDDGE